MVIIFNNFETWSCHDYSEWETIVWFRWDFLPTETNFTNSSGWPDDNHYTTAEDLAKIAQYTIENHYELYQMYKLIDLQHDGYAT